MDLILEQYRTRLQSVKKSAPATMINFDKAARRFQRHLDALGRKAREMESWDLEEYLAGLELAPTTTRTHWIHLGGAYRYAHRRGMLQKDVTLDVYLKEPPNEEPKIIPNSDLRKMKKRLMHDREWLIFHLLAYTGMRQGEIRALRWGEVDLEDGLIYINKAKGDQRRRVPIHPALAEVLNAEREETPEWFVVTTKRISPIAYDTWLDDLKSFAPGYTAHWFRRTITSSLLNNGVDERLVQRIMGWKPQTVMGRFYDNVSAEQMQRAVLKLYADDPV